jgi:hypothetical protein
VKPDEPALQGPKVKEAGGKPTLVEKDFNGRLKRLEMSAEEAALKLLTIDDATKAKIDVILGQRAAIMDKALIENIDLVVQMHNAGQSGDKAEALRLLQEFGKKLEPLKARGKLMDEVSDVLPDSQRPQFVALVKEYREAAVRDTIEQARSRGEEMTLKQAAGKELVQAIGQEIKRSYERQILSKTADYEKLLASLDLKPEQESTIRRYVTDYVQETKYKATAEQKRALFMKIYGQLDSGQRKKFVEYYRAQ